MILIFGSFMSGNYSPYHKLPNTKSDTLNVAYTYWWPTGGPFVGECGDSYSLVFTGTITKLYNTLIPNTTRDTTTVLYTPQKGIIKINEMKYKKNPDKAYKKSDGKCYNGELFFSSDCFYESGLKEGDKVIVFIYSYEGEYCIPGQSILKINNFDDPIVLSIDKYIKYDYDPLSIKDDLNAWKKYNLDYALKQIIDCRLSIKK